MRDTLVWGLLAIVAVMAGRALGQAPRETLSLNGAWEWQAVRSLDSPPGTTWAPFEVPGTVPGVDGRAAWFRKRFRAPESWRGKRVEIAFGGVKYNSRVFVNGTEIGGCFNGYDPFAVDATAAVRLGEESEVLLGCRDWSGVFGAPVDLTKLPADWEAERAYPVDAILSPIGGLYGQFGPWDDVEVRAVPRVRAERVSIATSVRGRTLTVEATLANDGDEPVEAGLAFAVLDGGKEVRSLPGQRATIPARGTVQVTAKAEWRDPHLWSHEDPHLYHLRTRLSIGGKQADERTDRFGFREFWASGPDLYLNGVRVCLRASSAWPMHQLRSKEEVLDFWRHIKAGNNIAFRTHTQPWRKVFYDAADEVGVLVIPEGAVWNDDDVYRINDPAFWRNYGDHLRRMSEHHRNNPSVVMYSLENEFYGGRMNERNTFATEQLADLGRKMKQWDPTRPITYESDGDPLGVTDVIGLHYPHEYPQANLYPNTCWWLNEEPGTYWEMFGREADGRWRWKRDKPLYIGEFLWVPSADPSSDTVLLGDEAYTDYARTHLEAKALAWKMQIEGYRDTGVAGICPWTEVEGGPLDDTNPLYVSQRAAFRPIAAFPREYSSRFFGGEAVRRTFVVYNDALSAADLTLRWRLLVGDRPAASGEEGVRLGAGAKRDVAAELRGPAVRAATAAVFEVRLERGGREEFLDRHPVSVHPRRPLALPAGVEVTVYDPKGALNGAVPESARRVADLSDRLPAGGVLIVGPDAFPKDATTVPHIGRPRGASPLEEYAEAGGRVIVLAQSSYPRAFRAAKLTEHRSTMAFTQMPGHPLLKGIGSDDLKWWAGGAPGAPDHLVSRSEPARPESGGGCAVVTAAGEQGLAFAPLVERPLGRGVLLLCQLLVAEKAPVEPAAATLLQNLVDYAAAFAPSTEPVTVVSGSEAAMTALRTAGVRLVDARESKAPVGDARLLLAEGAVPDASSVLGRVRSGATLVLHSPEQKAFDELAVELGIGWHVVNASGPVVRTGSDLLAQHLLREDLYWLGPHQGSPWSPTPFAPEIVDHGLAPAIDPRAAKSYDIKDMKWSGAIVQLLEDGRGLGMFTNGRAERDVDFGKGGHMLLGARLGGTPAGGVWPACRISVDGKAVGILTATRQDFADYALRAEVPPGEHHIALEFINDGSAPGEDRNLFLARLLVAPCDTADATRVVVEPGALAVIPFGTGRVVVDCVRWDSAGSNATRASRYLSGLLSALGAAFETPTATSVGLDGLVIDPGVPYADNRGGVLSFASAGAASGQVEVLEEGDYDLSLVGRGTKAAGAYPIVEVSFDGSVAGMSDIDSDAFSLHPAGRVHLTKGPHTLRVRFTNDLYAPPEDRNVWLERLEAKPAGAQ